MRVLPKLMIAVLAALWLTGAAGTAGAQCLGPGETRDAVASGQAVPLAQVTGAIRARGLGEVIGAKLCRAGGRLVYEVTVLAGNGNARRISVDAASGAIGN